MVKTPKTPIDVEKFSELFIDIFEATEFSGLVLFGQGQFYNVLQFNVTPETLEAMECILNNIVNEEDEDDFYDF